MKRLMLVRHGESQWNAGRRLQGQADITLSHKGEAQAQALRPYVEALAPQRVVTSPLKRARDTALHLGFPEAEARDELREIDVGTWTGEAIGDLIERDAEAYRGWRAGRHTPPEGESWAAFKDRASRLAHETLSGPESRILLVSHGGVLRALLESLLDLSPDRIVPVGPGSLSVLQHARRDAADKIRLEVFNFSPGGPVLDAPD